MILYLTRHGETQYNALGMYCGSTNIPLNKTGFLQAHELAKSLSHINFDVIISSSMLRACQTADVVCASISMPYSINEQFSERKLGVYEGLTRDEAKKLYPKLWNKQCIKQPDIAPCGGETVREACRRIDKGMLQLLQDYKGKTVLLICHGFVASAVNRFCNNLSFEEMINFNLGNCEISSYTLNFD